MQQTSPASTEPPSRSSGHQSPAVARRAASLSSSGRQSPSLAPVKAISPVSMGFDAPIVRKPYNVHQIARAVAGGTGRA